MNFNQSDRVVETVRTLSPFERLVFGILVCVCIISIFFSVRSFSNAMMVDVPVSGGELHEGIVGSPRFINPLLAASQADRDVAELLYAGLMKPRADGTLEPDLAERYTISEDGLTYRFVLREDITFHDGEPVTVEDVLFTVTLAQDPALKSSKFASWEGVQANKINDRELEFVLPESYAPFLENTTLGILPKHLWEKVTIEEFPFSQFNIEPIGAGPYKLEEIERNDVGIPEVYTLSRFNNYALGEPHIKRIHLQFFRSEEEVVRAFSEGSVMSVSGISPERVSSLASEHHTVLSTPLPRIFGVFFNKNRNELFAEAAVREALALSVDREKIVQDVLYGYGSVLNSPIPLNILPAASTTAPLFDTAQAQALLEEAGWEKVDGVWHMQTDDESLGRPLAFSLATANTPELKHAAEIIAENWRQFGVQVELTVYEPSDLTNTIIRPRRYDALFFGEVVGRELDLFAFWHSSQRNDPGLNIALYTNIQADALLKRARGESDREKQLEDLIAFQTEIENDVPAVFTHSPNFVYVIPKALKNVDTQAVVVPHERFLRVHEWYMDTSRVWSIFQ